MSFRAIWILSKDNLEKSQVLFSRKYPTVERRHHLIHGKKSSCALPDDNLVVKSAFKNLQIGRKTEAYMEEFDGCQQSKGEPVLKLDINGEPLWPIVALQKFNLIFICLCLVEKREFDSRTPLVEIPAISIGYALIHNMIEFIELVPLDNISQLATQIEELGMLLKILIPFGTPVDTNFSTMKGFLTGKDNNWTPKYRLSAWRPLAATKTRNQLHFSIREQVKAVIYNYPEKSVYKDMCHVYGVVSCKADVDGVPEVSLNFASNPNIHIAFHPCLQWLDVASNGRSGSFGNSSPDFYREQIPVSRTVCFTPPHELIPFCHVNGDSQLPVKGVFQMKTEGEVTQIQVQLQLSETVKNSFEYFEIHIPFFHSGPISKWELDNTWGAVLISPEKRKLVWSLGQKFPKSLQITLNATVLLADASTAEQSNFKEDPFCHGLNTYIQIYFKTTITTLSGITIDPKSVKLNPRSSPKVYVVKELVSSDYKIWNTHGDALVAFPPTL
ncbi:AP-5 complex subunit mu-1-like [Dendronephthya gigantea]|uniref:AP-5 complex subunit mu-1-like n=1 Tax=Dendronephthya gigantea TaxID=151771 RepID=UPI00106A95CE|nr:AP-5 complex subunit mu-1-like [Dendronephthya gigantea]